MILGDGPIGLIHLQLAKYLYGAKVIVIGRINHRLEAARRMGADFVIELEENEGSPTSAIKEVLDVTEGKGADVSIIATPNPDAFEVARWNRLKEFYYQYLRRDAEASEFSTGSKLGSL